MKALCPAGCGKKFTSETFAKAHADKEHQGWDELPHKRKGWATPYGFVDFTYPVTYETACDLMKSEFHKFFNQPKEKTMNVITNERLDELLAASPAERITPEYMKSRIVTSAFQRVTDTMTLCIITLDNGYYVTGESACVNPENYKQEIGEKISYDNAFNKLWPLFGFLLAEKNLLNKVKAS